MSRYDFDELQDLASEVERLRAALLVVEKWIVPVAEGYRINGAGQHEIITAVKDALKR